MTVHKGSEIPDPKVLLTGLGGEEKTVPQASSAAAPNFAKPVAGLAFGRWCPGHWPLGVGAQHGTRVRAVRSLRSRVSLAPETVSGRQQHRPLALDASRHRLRASARRGAQAHGAECGPHAAHERALGARLVARKRRVVACNRRMSRAPWFDVGSTLA